MVKLHKSVITIFVACIISVWKLDGNLITWKPEDDDNIKMNLC